MATTENRSDGLPQSPAPRALLGDLPHDRERRAKEEEVVEPSTERVRFIDASGGVAVNTVEPVSTYRLVERLVDLKAERDVAGEPLDAAFKAMVDLNAEMLRAELVAVRESGNQAKDGQVYARTYHVGSERQGFSAGLCRVGSENDPDPEARHVAYGDLCTRLEDAWRVAAIRYNELDGVYAVEMKRLLGEHVLTDSEKRAARARTDRRNETLGCFVVSVPNGASACEEHDDCRRDVGLAVACSRDRSPTGALAKLAGLLDVYPEGVMIEVRHLERNVTHDR